MVGLIIGVVLIFVTFVCGKGALNVQPGETPTPFLYAAGTRVQLAGKSDQTNNNNTVLEQAYAYVAE